MIHHLPIPTPPSPPQTDIAKLLRFESSRKEKGELVSLDDYCDRMVDGQDVCAPRLLVSLGGGLYFQFKATVMVTIPMVEIV